MHDLVVDRSTQHVFVTLAGGLHKIAFESGSGAGIGDHLLGRELQVPRAHAFHGHVAQLPQYLKNQQPAAAHFFQLNGAFSHNHRIARQIVCTNCCGGSLLASSSSSRRPFSLKYAISGCV